jgi:hypothetical protein
MPDRGTAQVAEQWKLTVEARAEALLLIRGLFGIDTSNDADPLIDMPMIAELAGVAIGTPGAWQQRTKAGTERIPFPPPDDHRYHDKPQWRAITTIIEGFLGPSGRWPRGTAARESTRIERPHTRRAATSTTRTGLSGLRRTEPELADQLAYLRLDDGQVRTLGGWRRRLKRDLERIAELRQSPPHLTPTFLGGPEVTIEGNGAGPAAPAAG